MNGNDTRRVWKWFWAWEDEREEAWLRHMARQGWHLSGVGVPGLYVFTYDTPRDVAYRLDFKFRRQDWETYKQLFADAGWEFAGQTGSWVYFRKEVRSGEPDEIFTDAASKVRKYQSVMFAVAMMMLWFPIVFNASGPDGGTAHAVYAIGKILFMLFMVYALTCLMIRVRELKRRL